MEESLENIYLPWRYIPRRCLNLRDRNYWENIDVGARGRIIATAISLKLLDNCIITYVIPSGRGETVKDFRGNNCLQQCFAFQWEQFN